MIYQRMEIIKDSKVNLKKIAAETKKKHACYTFNK